MKRSSRICICCFARDLDIQSTLVSPFLAERAWAGEPELCLLVNCKSCGFRFFDRGLSDDEASSYYSGYRGEDYFLARHRHEPFYTRSVHNETQVWLSSAARRIALRNSLAAAGLIRNRFSALDWGGGSGILLRDIQASRKAVFDLNPSDWASGMEIIKSKEDLRREWDVVVCAQVLEHLSSPVDALASMRALLRPNGLIYLEVPDQYWCAGWQPLWGRRAWLQFLCRHPKPLLIADTISTACRVKLRCLPPYGFIPMREHINFFTLAALKELLASNGFAVLSLEKNSLGCLAAVGRVN